MPNAYTFASTTPRLGLPNLFVAQAQKEMTINEAFALIDALMHAVVEGEANSPPPSPSDGDCWIIGSSPNAEWSGKAGHIACRQSGNWLFVAPVNGMTAFDTYAGQTIRYADGWHRADSISGPAGGTVVDAQARNAIEEILAALSAAGITARA